MSLLILNEPTLIKDVSLTVKIASLNRMRDMINVLEQFCDRWKMKINLEKTKIMVFRRGGKIRKGEAFYI